MTKIRVYYADTDALGIVYHANYLRYFELARTESLRQLGIELPFLLAEYGIQFAVVQAVVKYHKPARLDDELLIISRVTAVGKASVTYQQKIQLANKPDTLLCEAEVKLVAVDQEMRPKPLPDALKLEIVK